MWLELIRVDARVLVRPAVLRTERLGWPIFSKVEIDDIAPASQRQHEPWLRTECEHRSI